jgi:hypothetical protein
MQRSVQALDHQDGRNGTDLASGPEVDAGSIGVPHHVGEVVDAATGEDHVGVGVVRDAKSGVVVVFGEIR